MSKKTPPIPSRRIYGETSYYRIVKYGDNACQTFKMDPKTYVETAVDPENPYGVIASNIVDMMIKEIRQGAK